jgi:hypothetical protein
MSSSLNVNTRLYLLSPKDPATSQVGNGNKVTIGVPGHAMPLEGLLESNFKHILNQIMEMETEHILEFILAQLQQEATQPEFEGQKFALQLLNQVRALMKDLPGT